MKVLILGAGVIGVTSAYYLAKAGHAVTVVDRRPGAGLETSFANAGEISPGYSSPWAGPGVPVKAIKWLLMQHGPLAIRPTLDIHMYAWLAKMLRNCTTARYDINKKRMLPLAEYSRLCLHALRDETGITYDGRARGTLQLFRTQKQLDGASGDVAILKQLNVPCETLDAAGCVAAEPGLAPVQQKFVGGLRLPNDETGDCYLFTDRLGKLAAEMGVTFLYDTAIEGIDAEGDRVTRVRAGGQILTADCYVVALGSYAPLLLRPVGIDIPVYPVKGYSLTLPVADDSASPVSTVMDETYKIAITRLGDRIRVGGTAEIAGYSSTLRPGRRETLVHSLVDLFPQSGDPDKATFWTGLRPMTPDGPPLIGTTRYPNLYLNTGHGTLGWTMSCGSGRVLADLVSGRKPDIETADLSLDRYR